MKITAVMAGYPREWLDLFQRLVKHQVTDWKNTGEDEYVPSADRFEVSEIADADTVSSLIGVPGGPETGDKMGAYDHEPPKPKTWDDLMTEAEQPEQPGRRHVLLIDIDHPAYLVPSTTPGHSHLYVEVPDGIADDQYWPLIKALAEAGVIERGYYQASEARGFTAARLPWVKKPQPEAENETAAVLSEDDDLLEDL